MAKDSSELRFRPSSPRYGHFSVSARGTRPGPKRAHLGSNGHRFGVKRVQTQPKADPNVTQLHSMQQQRQLDLTLGPEEALGPVFGPFWAGTSPGARAGPFGVQRSPFWGQTDPNTAKSGPKRYPIVFCPSTTATGPGTAPHGGSRAHFWRFWAIFEPRISLSARGPKTGQNTTKSLFPAGGGPTEKKVVPKKVAEKHPG